MKSAVLIAIALAASTVFAEKQPIERYQSIIDRQMFGPLPPGFDPTKSPNEVQKTSSKDEKQLTQEQEKLQSSIHFSVINVASDGQPEVGFTDNSDPKVPKHYFLKVGESRDGWTVKDASAENATMTIAKGEIEVSLSLGGNSAKDGGTSKAGGAAATVANGNVRRSGFSGGGLLGGGSLRARRLQRQQAAEADAAKQREELAAKEAERQAQVEADKQQREAERAEQRQQLLAIQEELKKVREQKAAAAKNEGEGNGDGAANDDAE